MSEELDTVPVLTAGEIKGMLQHFGSYLDGYLTGSNGGCEVSNRFWGIYAKITRTLKKDLDSGS